MKNRSLFWYVTPSFLLVLILGVIMPWSIGVVLHKNVLKRFQALENHPNYSFILQEYESGVYHSRVQIEIRSKSSYLNKPQIHLVLEENIQQGPVILDWKAKKCFFNLAKINSRIVPQETPFIKFDQNELRSISLVSYRWKEDFVTHVEKVSGRILIDDNKPYTFSLQGMGLKGNLDFSELHVLQELNIAEAQIADTKKNSMNLKNIHMHFGPNLAMVLSSGGTQDLITCDTIEFNINKHKMMLTNPNLQTTLKAGIAENLLSLETRIHFDELRDRDHKYGPLDIHLAMDHLPKVMTQDETIQKLKNLNRNKKNSKELYAFLKNEMQIENLHFDLKTFTLQLPGGRMTLQGDVALSPNNDPELPYDCAGKLTASLPKQALHHLLSPIHAEMLITNGLLLELDDTLKGFLVLKPKNLYLNGANPFDALSRFETTSFKLPFSPEQNLFLALLAEDNDRLHTLVKEGVHLQEAMNPGGKSPLHLAAFMGNNKAVRLFLSSTIDVNLTDHQGNTALYWAARAGHKDIVQHLLKAQASVDVKNTLGWTPLQEASEHGHTDIVALLLEKEAPVNTQDNEGRTALFWAAKEGHIDVIKLLLNKGADPQLKNMRNITPLGIAEVYQRNAAVAVLKGYSRTGNE